MYDDLFLKHETGNHPENKGRLEAINQAIENSGLFSEIEMIKPIPATEKDILRIHSREYLTRVQETIKSGSPFLDSMDTVVSSLSFEAACLAAGAGITAADKIMNGDFKTAFCAVRPPGHHAEEGISMGFCIFNNIAITAKYLQQVHGINKVMILDWDVHHGNGTEKSFYEDNTVFYISLHQYPHYPGTGARADIGRGKGKNFTLNIPMSAGSNDQDYLNAFKEEVIPSVKTFAPGFILISAGFDANKADPLSSVDLSPDVFGTFTEMIVNSTNSYRGRIISFLEGGYDYDALAKSVLCHLSELNK